MNDHHKSGGGFDLGRWLRSPVSVTAPGWAFAAAGTAALVLLVVALD